MIHGTSFLSAHRTTALVIAGLLLVVAIFVAGDELSRHLHAIETFVAQLGPLGIALFIVLYVLATSLLIPESILAAAAGAVFGFWWGVFAVLTGGVLAAVLQYGLARRWLRGWILRFAERHPSWRAVHVAVQRDENRLQWLLRVAPFNPAMISYLLGSFGVHFGRFVLASLAITPHVALEVYAGYAAGHFIHASTASGGSHLAHDLLLAGGLVVAVAVLHRVAQIARRALSEAA